MDMIANVVGVAVLFAFGYTCVRWYLNGDDSLNSEWFG